MLRLSAAGAPNVAIPVTRRDSRLKRRGVDDGGGHIGLARLENFDMDGSVAVTRRTVPALSCPDGVGFAMTALRTLLGAVSR
jgi:hypothetical protein